MPDIDGVLSVSLTNQTDSGRFKPLSINDPPPKITGVVNDDYTPVPVVGTYELRVKETPSMLRRTFIGSEEPGVGEEFFGDVYVIPREIDAGIVLTQQTHVVEVFNAYQVSVDWTNYDDADVGDGVSLQNPDPPPGTITIGPLAGSVHDLVIDTVGPPSFNADADFTFITPDGMVHRFLSLQGQRSLIFPYEPEVPITEDLEWVTRILTSRNGKEQRSSIRKTPRSTIKLRVVSKDSDRRGIENAIFDGQGRAYGVPVWYESTRLTASINVGNTTCQVENTDLASFRVGQVAIVWQDSENFEALQVDSFTSTVITFSSAFTKSFDAANGVLVMPVASALLLTDVDQSRWPVVLQENSFAFVVIDNDIDLADTSSWNTFQPSGGTERVLLDEPNLLRGSQISESWNRPIVIVDNETSFPVIGTAQEVSRKGSNKGFFTRSRQELWNMRALLHALAGRRVSFYLPTFFTDLLPVQDITAVDQAIQVEDNDYVNLVQERQHRNIVRIHKTDGTKSDPLVVTGSSKPSPGVESISFAPVATGITATVEEVERIEYVEKVRLDSDRITIRHENSAGKAFVSAPVVGVLEEDD